MWKQLDQVLREVRTRGRVPAADWPGETPAATEFGLQITDGHLSWPQPPDYLREADIVKAFPQRQVQVFDCIDSTNSYLLSQQDSIADRLCTAELQVGGRGRRGRSWVSPYGRNLAMSMGFATHRQMAELGGLSTVVGLALAAGFEDLGVPGVALKWPNDVLVDQRKLCGILVELVTRPGRLEYVVGAGVNVVLSEAERQQIGQPAADLHSLGVQADRTSLLVKLLSRVVEFLDHFEAGGFAPFTRAFDQAHMFHGRQCEIHQGEQRISGIVKGVGDQGELILQTDQGEQRFHGGEVSLRPVSSAT